MTLPTSEQLQKSQESAWLKSAVGLYLQAQEQVLFDAAVFDLFGFNALQMGFEGMALLDNSRISNRWVATETVSCNGQLCCADDFLPFADMSIDVLLLPHRLEFSERPHQTLREAARVLMPDGYVLISGFNPISSWGLTSAIHRCFSHPIFNRLSVISSHFSSFAPYPWHGRFIRLSRLKDWLALLGFEVMSVEMACHVPPFQHGDWQTKLACLDQYCRHQFKRIGFNRFGGVYFIVAKKRLPGITPLKPQWKVKPIKAPLIARPTKPRPMQNNKY